MFRVTGSNIIIFQVQIAGLRPRKLTQQRLQCSVLKASQDRDSFSVEYRITERSILDEVPHFDLCACLPHDIMHMVFEGVLNPDCKLLLHYLINEQRLLTLKELNETISTFPYSGRDAINAPKLIDQERVGPEGSKITQSGMYCMSS